VSSRVAWPDPAHWRDFFDLLSDAVVVLDARGCIALANTAALRLMPCEPGGPVEQLQPAIGGDAVRWLRRCATSANADPLPPPTVWLADGRSAKLQWRRLDAQFSALQLAPANGETIAREGERRREAEARMSQAQAQLQRIIEAAPLAITLRDARTLEILQINGVAAANAGTTPAALIGLTPEQTFDAATAARRRHDMEQALASAEVTTREYRVEQDGEPRVWDARYLPLASEPGAPPDQLLMVATDVTEQRAAQEARLEAAIAQREMLVKEVHHRIKNNLQGVAGLLQQIAQRKPEVAESISEVVGQVHAIAQVYGLQVGESGALQLVGVLRAITASVQRTFGRAIHFEMLGAGSGRWRLPESESIPIALTLNELLTNAVKHCAGGGGAAVLCTLDGSDAGVEIVIANPGRLAADFNLARVPGGVSGLGLVRALLPRRGARLSLEPHAGQVRATVLLAPPVVTLD
jgi:two-component sensor histidine kinase/PAS domain-containing protein